jgi:hypothetical protein
MVTDGCCPPGCTEHDDSDCESGLVAHWTFDASDISGDQALDVSGLGNHGTIYDAIPVTGRVGEALEFNDSDSVSVPDTATLDITDSLTIMAWVMPESISGVQDIVTKNGGNPYTGNSYSLFHSSGYVYFKIDNASSNDAINAGPLSAGKWHHIAGTWDGGTARLFIDGKERVTDDDTIGQIRTSSNDVNIGGTQWHFNGTIDDVMLWNRSLTGQEIQDIYDSAFHPADDNPKNGCIEQHELISFIDLWKYDSDTYTMSEMMDATTLYYDPIAGCSEGVPFNI